MSIKDKQYEKRGFKTLTIQLTGDEYAALKKCAEREQLTLIGFIRFATNKYIQLSKKRILI